MRAVGDHGPLCQAQGPVVLSLQCLGACAASSAVRTHSAVSNLRSKQLGAESKKMLATRCENSEQLFGQIAKLSHVLALIPPSHYHQILPRSWGRQSRRGQCRSL